MESLLKHPKAFQVRHMYDLQMHKCWNVDLYIDVKMIQFKHGTVFTKLANQDGMEGVFELK